MKQFLLILVIVVLVPCVKNANILTLLPLAGKSHHVMFERIVRGLANKGHQVDFVNHFPLKNPPPGYNDMSLKGTLKIFVNNLTINEVQFKTHLDTMDFMLTAVGVKTCETLFQSDVLKNLRNTTKKYDLIITEVFTVDCMIGFAHIFKVPVISLTTSVNLPWGSDRFGLPDNPSYIPNYFMDYSPKMTLYERFWNTVYLIISKLKHYNGNIEIYQASKDFFGEDLPSLNDLIYNTTLLFVNSHFSSNQARPTVPGFIEIGGVHINDPKPLDQHFQELLKTELDGIIYLSMGSMIKTESFPIEKIQAMFDVFAELPYKVIWKADVDQFPKGVQFAKNIHFKKWMPQLDILCSSKVNLFVSHGGLMGSQEAVYCGVPRLGIPLFADQELNIRQAEKMGQAIKVDYNEISKQKILNAAKELLYNQKYQQNAKKFSVLFKDRPMSALDTAIYWTEYVIRHKGAPHLKSQATELSWYQYFLLDVALIFLSILFFTIYVLVMFAKLLLLLVGSKPKNKKD
ncbi:unnamed protein product [Brassicogethes aeneus]|uniref:UDP-glucuronosyltransferase n=1 Tax=Brassicogethes aeneus TaxID=1431903 RepID=A0A9P0FL31_BRAAE|nr:unnamed protein product [Brassicogethes aeneus]